MATITITMDDDIKGALIDSICAAYKYPAQITDDQGKLIDNPISKEKFTQNVFISFGKQVIASVGANQAAETARQRTLSQIQAQLDAAVITVN